MADEIFICLIFFVSGCIVDAMALITLTIPIIYPVILQFEFRSNLVWGGDCADQSNCGGDASGGVNVYVIKGIAPDVPITSIFRGSFPYC